MQFRTSLDLSKSNYPITYTSKILLLGSCFSDNIGQKFNHHNFNATANPFGVIFNPLSLQNILERVVHKKMFTPNDIHQNQDLFFIFEVHSKFSNTSSQDLLLQLNDVVAETHEFLKTASHVFITLGSAWVYEHLNSQCIVANCHKVPQKFFTKKVLTYTEIYESLQKISSLLTEINPKINQIFTISPVRHLKDGFVNNNWSKALLIAALHQFLENENAKAVYFPSYELVLDDLRDYRFFEADMMHPNTLAIDYIWQKLIASYTDANTQEIMTKIEAIKKAENHKPINPESQTHRQFVSNLQKQKNNLLTQYPFLNL